jgi:UDP-3-O-[3-hydroxymyristoyl] glucosamine N-acyltransferase
VPAPLSAADVAALVQGRLVGDDAGSGAVGALTSVAPLDRAGAADVSFLASARYLDDFAASRAGAVLVGAEHERAPGPPLRIVVPDPHAALLTLVRALYPAPAPPTGIDPTARIGRGAVLGTNVAVGAHAVIGAGARLGDGVVVMEHAVVGAGVTVGAASLLYPHVVCYRGTVIGARVIVHAGARLGVDGFGYVPTAAGHEKVPHVGRCIIGDDVEIGANTTIDRGSVDDTVIGAGTKIDNLVHIGHNCRVGRRCLIMAQVGMAGSMRIEDEAILAGQAGFAGHLTVGTRARVGAQSGVTGDVAPGAMVSGYPARPHRDVMRATAALYRLTEIVTELEALVERERGRA